SDVARFDNLLQPLAPYLTRQIYSLYKLGILTCCTIFTEVCQAIWHVLKEDFVAYPSVAKWAEIIGEFGDRWNYPFCAEAVDGKHIQMRAPANSGSEYYNYKSFSSIVLMAVCKASCRYQDQSACWGPKHRAHMSFVVDEAFPLRANLMRPYPGSSGLDEAKKIDNYRHSRTRRISEKGFGILAGIWRVLGRALELASEKAEAIVKACMALHNYLCTTDTTDTDNTVVETGGRRGHQLPGLKNMLADRATSVAIEVCNNLEN
uniref:DDE Tnp4 domain-containing protein n=1 Tax=Oncorhynchus tshawytscha TaxID=74940 RepID=A0AAZ3PL96_ONCTS